MLVDRQVVFSAVVFLEILAEPMRKALIDTADGFAEPPPAQRRSAAAGIVGNHDGKPLVLSAGPKGGLTQARVPQHGHTPVVNVTVGLKVVHGPAQSPCPGANGAPGIRWAFAAEKLIKVPVYTILKTIVKVRVDVTIVNCCQTVAACENLFDRIA